MSTTVRHEHFKPCFKIHAASTVEKGLRGDKTMTTAHYVATEAEAYERCRELLAKKPHSVLYIFKTIAMVRTTEPPIEVIHLDEEQA